MNNYEARVAAAIRTNADPTAYFPQWKDPGCKHPLEARVADATGWICAECGKVAWR